MKNITLAIILSLVSTAALASGTFIEIGDRISPDYVEDSPCNSIVNGAVGQRFKCTTSEDRTRVFLEMETTTGKHLKTVDVSLAEKCAKFDAIVSGPGDSTINLQGTCLMSLVVKNIIASQLDEILAKDSKSGVLNAELAFDDLTALPTRKGDYATLKNLESAPEANLGLNRYVCDVWVLGRQTNMRSASEKVYTFDSKNQTGGIIAVKAKQAVQTAYAAIVGNEIEDKAALEKIKAVGIESMDISCSSSSI